MADRGIDADTLSDSDFRDRYPGYPPRGWGDRMNPLGTPDGQQWRSRTSGKTRIWQRVN